MKSWIKTLLLFSVIATPVTVNQQTNMFVENPHLQKLDREYKERKIKQNEIKRKILMQEIRNLL